MRNKRFLFALLVSLLIDTAQASFPENCFQTAKEIVEKFVSHPRYSEFHRLEHISTFSPEGGNIFIIQNLEGFFVDASNITVIDCECNNENVTFSIQVKSDVVYNRAVIEGNYKGRNVYFRASGTTSDKIRIIFRLSYHEQQDKVDVGFVKVFNMRQWTVNSSCKLNTERCRTFHSLLANEAFPEMERPFGNTVKSILSDVKLQDQNKE
jgi:hypothetical protein